MTDKPVLDEKKLRMMKIRILDLERKNLKTQENTSPQMSDKIRAIITEEVKKTY